MSAGRESMVWNHTEILCIRTVRRRAIVSQDVCQVAPMERHAQELGTLIAHWCRGFPGTQKEHDMMTNQPGPAPGNPVNQPPPGDSRAPGVSPTHPDRAPQTSPADTKPGERPIADVDRKVREGDA